MHISPALFITACFVVATSLGWLALALADAAAARSPGAGRAVLAVAISLLGGGLLWPGHVMEVAGLKASSSSVPWLWSWLPALTLSGLTFATGRLWRAKRHAAAIPVLLGVPVATYAYAMFNAPGIFRLTDVPGNLGAFLLVMALSTGLLVVQWPFAGTRVKLSAQLGGLALAVAGACFGAVVSVPMVDEFRWLIGTDWWVVFGVLAISAVLLMVAVPEPVTERTDRLLSVPNLDSLTRLPTRLFFEAQLAKAAAKCDQKSSRLAVLFVDLDGFKLVNDSFGHGVGDRVLEEVGQRMLAAASGLGLAARVGSDQFLLLASRQISKGEASRMAKALVTSLSQPYKLTPHEIVISCSIGVALYPDGCDASKLIARADAAMYAAKKAGGARRCFYSRELEKNLQQRSDMLRDLRQALVGDELELFFQPKIDARSGKVTAAEALLRWNHPTRGVVMPSQFIPLAERSGLIAPLGNWVIEAACKQARAWRDKGLRMRVAINLSAHQMHQNDIADRIASALQRYRIQPALLTCEITESAAMEDTAATQETFRRLGEMGTHLSIDDFGTGYSSLAYLRRLPAEELKIDASFIKDLDSSNDARAVVDAVIKLAHALGLKVVAEGVENPRQHKILLELGCDELQGYLFAKPMTATALLIWAIDDRASSSVFRNSLFGETRELESKPSAVKNG